MRTSVMQHGFSMVPSAEIQRSVFNRNFRYLTTLDAGYLVPIFHDEKLPGDTDVVKGHFFGRLNTPIKPIMDNLYLDVFYFYVPNRLVWTNWQRMMGERDPDPDSTIDFTVPIATAPVGGYLEHSLQDYFGLPTKVAGYQHIQLPLRAYNLIWNQWFRDQNLQNSVVVDKGDGPDTVTDYVLLKRGKRHDYFTSCLPWPQTESTGQTPVTLPLGTSAPVYGDGTALGLWNGTTQVGLRGDAAGALYVSAGNYGDPVGTAVDAPTAYGTAAGVVESGNSGLYADLTSATSATINQLRQAFQIQRMYERDARGGTRYPELLKSHFGVTSPDARLQRAEFLGAATFPINVTPIAQNSATGATGTPQGNLAAMGTVSGSGGYTKSFTEHGWVIGLANIRADLTYQEGLLRYWSRQTRFDYYWPSLAHIGEQAVLNKEIYCVGTGGATDGNTFGYQGRFDEYRYKTSQVTGLFRSNATGTLDLWHLSLELGALPTLNAAFIQDSPPIDRVVEVTTEPDAMLDCYFEFKSVRPMPVFGVPGMIDRF